METSGQKKYFFLKRFGPKIAKKFEVKVRVPENELGKKNSREKRLRRFRLYSKMALLGLEKGPKSGQNGEIREFFFFFWKSS